MGKNKDADHALVKLRDAQGLMEDLRELGKGTVALYTLVGEDKFRVILTTADVQKAYRSPDQSRRLESQDAGLSRRAAKSEA